MLYGQRETFSFMMLLLTMACMGDGLCAKIEGGMGGGGWVPPGNAGSTWCHPCLTVKSSVAFTAEQLRDIAINTHQ